MRGTPGARLSMFVIKFQDAGMEGETLYSPN